MVTRLEERLGVPLERIARFCREHHIRKLSIFGSALREDFRQDSDIDVLVEFEPGETPGFAFFGMQEQLAEMIGRKVDLITAGFLCDHIRDRVLTEAEVLYPDN